MSEPMKITNEMRNRKEERISQMVDRVNKDIKLAVSRKHIPRLSIEEVRNKYLNYKLNGGELNWNDFQKKIKEDTIDI